MTQAILNVFTISHYCEKARWAFDYLGVPYRVQVLAPGAHLKLAREHGLRRGGLPFLLTDAGPVQGSAAVVTWAEQAATGDGPVLSTEATRDTIAGIERRLDDVAGVHSRRHFYSEAILTQPKAVRSIFMKEQSLPQRLKLFAGWGTICRLMARGMDLGPAQREDSRDALEREFDWLDGLLADGRPYLAGEQFSRADIAAASLLAPAVRPPDHPLHGVIASPPLHDADVARWAERPTARWVRAMYAQHRGRTTAS
ncbi:MAG: glutathione S-transferase family protein [Pseudomonadota bacterium]